MGLYDGVYPDGVSLEWDTLDRCLAVFLLCGMLTNLYRSRNEYRVHFKRGSFLLGRENVYFDNDSDGNECGVFSRISDYQFDVEKLGDAE